MPRSLESRAIECRAPRVAQLKTAAENWQSSVVEPLRQLRHAWKTSSEQDPALARLRERIEELELDAERKATMVGNLLVVLCGEAKTQPVINAGSLY